MKLRQSGMPEEAYWETLFDGPGTLDRLGIDGTLSDVAELGCGYGTFTLPVARRIRGTLTALDVDPRMIERTAERAREAGIANILPLVRDVVTAGFGVPPASQDAVLLFNILHGEEPVHLLRLTREVLKASGRAFVIHWRYDSATPRGPSMDIRPRPEDVLGWAREAGFQEAGDGILDLPPWHWGAVFKPI
jgi:SAM-dependent methyltransferase